MLTKKHHEACDSEISKEGLKTPKKLVYGFHDIVKLNLDAEPPADIKPHQIRLKPNALSVRPKQRKYPP